MRRSPPSSKDYVATGEVYLIRHEFPLPQHAYGRLAALYATAAARLGAVPGRRDA
jgi:hypothetical protein